MDFQIWSFGFSLDFMNLNGFVSSLNHLNFQSYVFQSATLSFKIIGRLNLRIVDLSAP